MRSSLAEAVASSISDVVAPASRDRAHRRRDRRDLRRLAGLPLASLTATWCDGLDSIGHPLGDATHRLPPVDWCRCHRPGRPGQLPVPERARPGRRTACVLSCGFTQAGLPRPLVNQPVFDLEEACSDRSLDPEAGLATEFDGQAHRERRQLADLRRGPRAANLGGRVDSLDFRPRWPSDCAATPGHQAGGAPSSTIRAGTSNELGGLPSVARATTAPAVAPPRQAARRRHAQGMVCDRQPRPWTAADSRTGSADPEAAPGHRSTGRPTVTAAARRT